MNKLYNYNDLQIKLVQALFHQQHLIPKINNIVTSDDFNDDKLKNLYIAMSELNYQGNDSIKLSDLYEFHINHNQPFPDDLYTLLTTFPMDIGLNSIARLLKTQSVKEKTKNKLLNTVNELNSSSDPQELIGKAEEFLGQMTQALLPKNTETLSDSIKALSEQIKSKEPPKVEAVPLFFKSLEKPLRGGWHPEQLITIGARTSVGKSVFAVDSAVAACAAGRSVLFFSLEMSKDELLKRMMSVTSGVILNKLEAGVEKSEEEYNYIDEATKEIATWKLNIDDTADVTLEHIKAKAKMQSQSENGLDFIIVDYLQLINTSGTKAKSRQEAVAELSRGMKLLAKQLKVPIMIVVQLNREDKNEDENRLPSKADIRESGAIAADSDVIIILHRKYRDDSPDPKALFILDKNRNGPVNRKYSMRCVLEKSMFTDVHEDEEESNDYLLEDNSVTADFDSFYSDDDTLTGIDDEFTADFGGVFDE